MGGYSFNRGGPPRLITLGIEPRRWTFLRKQVVSLCNTASARGSKLSNDNML
jgi:hypothetical protein